MKPNFLIVGAEKSGTTSLWASLREHPGVHVANEKELHYFDGFANGVGVKTVEWYEGNFDPVKDDHFTDEYIVGQTPTGEASPTYCYFNRPDAMDGIYAYDPSMRLIMILRDPVLRTISAYQQSSLRLQNDSFTLMDALAREDVKLGPGYEPSPEYNLEPGRGSYRFAYKDRGRYVYQIDKMHELFPEEQIHVCQLSDMAAHPMEFMRQITDFIGVRPWDGYSFTVYLKSPVPYTPSAEALSYLSEFFAADNAALSQKYGVDISEWL